VALTFAHVAPAGPAAARGATGTDGRTHNRPKTRLRYAAWKSRNRYRAGRLHSAWVEVRLPVQISNGEICRVEGADAANRRCASGGPWEFGIITVQCKNGPS